MNIAMINGKIFVGDENNSFVDSVYVEDGIIKLVNEPEKIKSLNGTKVIDLKGKTVLPGFNDSHLHLIGTALFLKTLKLSDYTSIAQIIQESKLFIKNTVNESEDWIVARGWNQDKLTEARMLTRYDLDKISTNIPICYIRACGHLAVINSKGLEILNIDKDNIPDINGGKIYVDEHGVPDGKFSENALGIIYDKFNVPDKNKIKDLIKTSMKELNKYGITSAQSDDFMFIDGVDYEEVIKAYVELSENNEMSVRVNQQCLLKSVSKNKSFLDKYKPIGDNFYRLGCIKLLLDGSLGSKTALMKDKYCDDDNTNGIQLYTDEDFNEIIKYASEKKFPLAIHGIGDKAIQKIVDVYNKYFGSDNELRNSIVHCQITDEKLLDEISQNNIYTFVQPAMLSYDLHICEDRVGKEKSEFSYGYNSMINKGIRMSFGTDSPIENINPLEGIYCAVNRKDLSGYPSDGWNSKECITVEQAVKAYTIESARASHEENIKGTVEVGKLGDFVVLDKDIFEIDKEEIKNVKVKMCIVGGKVVYEI